MRAIIIKDTDARALLHKLELTALRKHHFLRATPETPPTIEEMHRVFHYEVTLWLQEQGADTVG